MEKTAIYKPRREASAKTNPANTSVTDFQPPEMCDNTLLLFNPPSLWSFVTAAPVSLYQILHP